MDRAFENGRSVAHLEAVEEQPVHDTFAENQATELPDVVYAASVHPHELPATEADALWGKVFPRYSTTGNRMVMTEHLTR